MPCKLSAMALVIQLASGTAFAGPEGGVVKGGTGSITSTGNTTIIEQLSNRMAIDWQNYDVSASERVNYIQPSSSSISLNRILSNSGSKIQGQINANGHVILMNPHGVVFGENSTVNVGGLLASGLNIEADAFMNGDFALTALDGGEGRVINSGIINAATGGSVSFVGKQVENNGLIVANLGRVNLAAGKEAVVTFDNDGLMGVRVTKEVLQGDIGVDAAVVNNGEIIANGGQILLTASVSQDIFSQAVNLNGEAKSVVVHDDGSFTLGGGADVVNTGTLTTSNSSQANADGQIVITGGNITHSGLVEAAGGDIELHAQDTLLLVEQAVVTVANSKAGIGGTVKLLGNRVGLLGSASVNASGLSGGGDIYIGGDYKGRNAFLPNADRLYVGQGVSLNSSALISGNGGTLINWANSVNRFFGTAFSTGGTASGDGGFVEISANSLTFDGRVDVSASNGESGTVLFDPLNIEISTFFLDDAIDNEDAPFYSPANGTLEIDPITFSAAVSGSVVLEALNNISIVSDEGLDLTDTSITDITFIADAGHYHVQQGDWDSIVGSLIPAPDPPLPTPEPGDGITSGIFSMDSGFAITAPGIDVTIYASGITLGTLNTSAVGRENGGNITLTAHNGNISATALTANGWSASEYSNGSDSSDGFAGGSIALNALGSIGVTNDISVVGGDAFYRTSSSQEGRWGGNGGAVSLTSACSSLVSSCIQVGSIDVSGGNASGDDSEDPGRGGHAGSITLSAASGLLSIAAGVDLIAEGGFGVGDEAIHTRNAGGNPTGTVATDDDGTALDRGVGGKGGAITLVAADVSVTGDLSVAGGIGGAGADGISGGSADQDEGASGGNAGSVVLVGNTVSITGLIDADGGDTGNYRAGHASGPVSGSGGEIFIVSNNAVIGNNFNVASGTLAEGVQGGSAGAEGWYQVWLGGDSGSAQITYDEALNHAVVIGEYIDANFEETDYAFVTYADATGSQTLFGPTLSGNAVNAWAITDSNMGTLNSNVSFTNIENLTGGDNVDNFVLSATGSISGTIQGGEGTDTLQALDTNNTWVFGHDGVLNEAGDSVIDTRYGQLFTDNNSDRKLNSGDTIYVNRFESLETGTGGTADDYFIVGADGFDLTIAGGNGNDTLVANTLLHTFSVVENAVDVITVAQTNNWVVDSTSTIDSAADGDTDVSFSGIEAIAGGDGADNFTVNNIATISGLIDGGAGDDTLTINYDVDASVAIAPDATASDRVDISAIEVVTAFSGSSSEVTLEYASEPSDTEGNYWVVLGDDGDGGTALDGTNDGQVNFGVTYSGDAVDTSTQVVQFNDFSTLTGGVGNDVFVANETVGVAFSASFDGGGGENTFRGDSVASTWVISDGGNSYNSDITFTSIQLLEGGSNTDDFSLTGSFSVTDVDGGGNVDELEIDNGEDNTWTINEAGTSDVWWGVDTDNRDGTVVFTDIEAFIGGEGDDDFVVQNFADSDFGNLSFDGAEGSNSLEIDIDTAQVWGLDGTDTVAWVTGVDPDAISWNIAFSDITTVIGGGAGDTFTVTGGNVNVIDGAAGADAFDVGLNVDGLSINDTGSDSAQDTLTLTHNVANNWIIDGSNTGAWDHDADAGAVSADYSVSFAGVESLVGGSAADVYTVSSTTAVNAITAGNGANIFTLSEDINSLIITGGTDTDTLNIDHSVDTTWLFDGTPDATWNSTIDRTVSFSGVDAVNAGGGADTFNVNTAITFSIDGRGGDDDFNLSANATGTLVGGAGNDDFFLKTDTLNYAITGGDDTDSVQIDFTADVTWIIDGGSELASWDDAGSVARTSTLTTIETLVGGDGGDIFNINTTTAPLVTSVEGRGGENSLVSQQSSGGSNAWYLGTETSGNYHYFSQVAPTESDTPVYVIGFSGIETLTGSAALNDVLNGAADGGAGLDTNSTWRITNENTGSYRYTTTAVAEATSFSSMEELHGGSGVDRFEFIYTSASEYGDVNAIDGGDGNDVLAAFDVSGIDNAWAVTGVGAGNVALETSPAVPYVVYTSIESLVGGVGTDLLNLSGYDGDIAVSVGTLTATDDIVDDFEMSAVGFEGAIGNDADGTGTYRSLLIVNDAASTASTRWSVSDVNDGTVEGLDTEGDSVSSFTFAGFNTLWGDGEVDAFNVGANVDSSIVGRESEIAGLGGADTFTVNTDVTLTANIMGGDDADVFSIAGTTTGNLDGGTGNDRFVIASTANVSSINGGDDLDTLVSPGSNSEFILAATNSLTDGAAAPVTYVTNFSSLEVLEGSGTDTLNATAYSSELIIDLAAGSASDTVLEVSGFSSLEANAANTNTLGADNVENEWSITGTNSGALNVGIAFTNFSQLEGGTNNDTFTLAGGSIGGSITGGGFTVDGADTLKGSNANTWWVIDGENDGFVSSSQANADADIGDLVAGFIDITALVGNNSNDIFIVEDAGSIAGASGGSDVGVDTLSYQNAVGPISIQLSAGAGVTGFSDIESYRGNNTNSTIGIASSVEGSATWNITQENDGNVLFTGLSESIQFENFNNVSGGANTDDAFNLSTTTASITSTLSGGAGGTDSITSFTSGAHFVVSDSERYVQISFADGTRIIQSFTGIEALNGNTGNDTFALVSTFSGAIDGGSGGVNQLDLTDSANVNWQITNADSGSVEGMTFGNIQTLLGSEGNDAFVLVDTGLDVGSVSTLIDGQGGSNSITGPNLDSRFIVTSAAAYIEENTGAQTETRRVQSLQNITTLTGGSANDEFEVSQSGLIGAATYNGGTGDNQITLVSNSGSDVAWASTSAGAGTVDVNTFSGMQVLVGGDGNDSFDISHSFTDVSGNAGNDTFTVDNANLNLAISGGASGAAGDTLDLAYSNSATWTLNGGTDETVAATGTITFSGIEVAHGSEGVDQFNVDAASVATLYGDAGSDIFSVALNIAPAIFGDNGVDVTAGTDVLVLNHSTDVTWTIDGSPSVENGLATLGFANIETVRGGEGEDTFNVTQATVLNVEGAGGSDTFNVNQSSLDINYYGEYFGAAADIFDDTLSIGSLYTDATTWTIAGSSNSFGLSAGGDTSSFSGIEIINGGAAVDTFNVSSSVVSQINGLAGDDQFNIQNASVAITVAGGAHAALGGDVLDLQYGSDATWTVDASVSQNVAANGGGSVVFSGIEIAEGSDGEDQFNISAAGLNVANGEGDNDIFTLLTSNIALVINGGGGTQNVVQTTHSGGAIWTIDTAPSLTHGGAVIDFSNIEIVRGGVGVDRFDISAASVDTAEGFGGEDTFNIDAGGLGLTLRGGSTAEDTANDYLVSRYSDNSTWTIDGGAVEALQLTAGGPLLQFSGVEAVTGGSGVDTFNVSAASVSTLTGGVGEDSFNIESASSAGITLIGGADTDSIFEISGSGSSWLLGATHTVNGGAGTVEFSSIENIFGRDSTNGADSFTIDAVFNGTIDGRNGNDTFIVNQSVVGGLMGGAGNDIFQIAASVSNDITGGTGDDTFWLNDLNVTANILGGSTGEATGDRIWGFAGESEWTVFANTDTSTITSTTVGTTGTVTFSFIENLLGRNDVADTFIVNAVGDTVNIDIEAGSGTSIDTVDFSNILADTVIDVASADLGGAERVRDDGELILTSSSSAAWTLTDFDGANAIADGVNDGTVVIDAEEIQFVDFQNIQGSAGQDSFVIADGTLSGSINGLGGGDTLSRTGLGSTWNITGVNTGTVQGVAGSFTGISVLQGNAGNDQFIFNDAGSWSGDGFQVIGGADTGVDSVVSNRSTASNWTVTAAGEGNVTGWLSSFSGIETLNGSVATDTFTVGAYINSIVGGASASIAEYDEIIVAVADPEMAWNLAGTNSGNIELGNEDPANYLVANFSDIENLTGGDTNDTFFFVGSVAVSGLIQGGAGINVLDQSELTGINWTHIDGEAYTEQPIGGNSFSILPDSFFEIISGDNAASNGLIGAIDATNWLFSTDNEGNQTVTVTFDGNETTYTNIGQVIGRNAVNDTFNFTVTGYLDGAISAGTGAGIDIINSPDISGVVPWNITSDGTGDVTFNTIVTNFSAIETLNGGSGPDQFLVQASDVSIADITIAINGGNGANQYTVNTALVNGIVGGAAVDVFNINAAVIGDVVGGGGSDQFIVATSAANINLIAGESAGDEDLLRIDYDTSSNWTLAEGGWQVTDNDGTVNTITFSEFETLEGSNRADTVSFNDAAFTGTFSGRDGADQFTLARGNLSFTLHGQDGVSADVANDTVINTHASDSAWTIAATDSSVQTDNGSVALTGIDAIAGGDGVDTISTTVAMLQIAGGGNDDQITLGADVTTSVLGGDGSDTFTLASDTISASFDGGNSVGDMDTLQAANSSNTNVWVVSSAGTGSLNNTGAVSFSNMENLTGGSGVDEFDINGALSGTVRGLAGNDTFAVAAQVSNGILGGEGIDQFTVEQPGFSLAIDGEGGSGDSLIYAVANGSVNEWIVSALNEGSVTNGETVSFEGVENIQGSTATDTFAISANISGAITGSDGENTFTFAESGLTTVVVGGVGSDTIMATHTDGGTWTNTADAQTIVDGSDAPGTITFSGVESFVAGDGNDDFAIGNATTSIATNGGIDTVVTSVAITGGVDLGEGDDTLQVTAANLSFAAEGGAHDNGDTFIGADEIAYWAVAGDNSGSYRNTTTDIISFTNFENLTGGTGNDTYTLNIGSTLDGVIDGGGHTAQIADPNAPNLNNDTFGDEIIATALIDAYTFIQENIRSGEGDYSFANVERLSVRAQLGEGLYDTIQSGNGVNSWVINGSNQGVLINEATGAKTYFTGFQNVQGGTGVDQFALQGNNTDYIDGQIHGGGGDAIDTIDFSLVDESVTVQIGAASGGVEDIEGVTGYRDGTVGANHQRILIGVDSGNDSEISTWTISDFDGVDVAADGINDGEFTRGGETFNFTNFNTFVGHDNNDQFIISGAGRLTGGVIGGGGTNTLNASTLTDSLSAELTNATRADLLEINPTDGIVQMSGISTVTGSASFANTLYGFAETANLWTIDAPNAGVVETVAFNNFANLVGGSGQDAFTFATATSLSGIIDGNGGALDSIDANALNDNQIVILGTSIPGNILPTLRVANVESIALDGSGNQLIADVTNNTWAFTGTDQGSISRTGAVSADTTVTFTGFGTLRGNTGNDDFRFDGAQRVTGVLLGGEGDGVDSLDLSGVTTAGNRLTVGLTDSVAPTVIADADFSIAGFESVDGSLTAASTLRGANENTNWQIDDTDAGTLNSTLAFKDFGSLVGGSGVDVFTFLVQGNSEGAITGGIDGGLQPVDAEFGDTVNMSALSAVAIQVGGDNGMENIERYVGNNANSELSAELDAVNAWVINAENSGTLNGNVQFEGFNILNGGDAVDNFSVTGLGSVTGAINAGGDNDTLSLVLAETSDGSLRFNGGADSDTLIVEGGGGALVAEYTPETAEAGISELEYSNEAENTQYQLQFGTTENVTDNVQASRLVVNDTAGEDSILLTSNSVTIGALTELTYANKDSLQIAASSTDTVTIENTLTLEQQLMIENAVVVAGDNAMVDVNSLVLDSTGNVGSAEVRLRVDVNELLIQSADNAIYIQDINQLTLAALSSTGVVDIVAEGNITDSAALVMQGTNSELNLTSNTGSVVLDNANSFGGTIAVVADENATINSAGRMVLAGLTAESATLISGGGIESEAAITVQREFTIDSSGNVLLANANNQLGSMNIVAANNISVADQDVLTVATANVSGELATVSEGLQVNGTIVASSANMDAGSHSATIAGTVSTSGSAVIVANGMEVLSAIDARDVSLDSGVGDLLLSATLNSSGGDVSLVGNSVLQNAAITSGNDLHINSIADVQQNGGIDAVGNVAIVSSGGSIAMQSNAQTSGAQVNYNAAGSLTVANIDGQSITLDAVTGIDQVGDLRSSGNIVSNSEAYVMLADTEMVSTTGSVNIGASGNVETQTVSASESVIIRAGSSLNAGGNIHSSNSSLQLTGNGGVDVSGELLAAGDISLASAASDIALGSAVDSLGGAVQLVSAGAIAMGELSSVQVHGENNVTMEAGSQISTATIAAETGTILLTSGGSVRDITQDTSVTGANLTIVSQNGIEGVFAGTENMFGNTFRADVNSVSLSNQQEEVRFMNESTVRIDHLGNNGDITFQSNSGDIVINNERTAPFVGGDDANLAGGISNANYDIGTLTLSAQSGVIEALGPYILNEPDIVATRARLFAQEYGNRSRALIFYVRDALQIGFGTSYGLGFYGQRPLEVQDDSNRQPGMFDSYGNGGEQLVAVEELEEIDPAIFTPVNNYFFDDVSIRLPEDQLYEDELEELAQAE
ncbi:filamentous hemagglutinin N-terminal domain-containing protein [Teredinibacter franksiae]|uniref:filamentous hemagglutinin N-terminal domain-containing protein n=1 Tax=Teredinibacter franksiae TaxID=2761453 RepID=UPI001625B5D2|nr:filamentous hemagglutinin N-terminal domain-containing protein [Teredinibacter franksiae]